MSKAPSDNSRWGAACRTKASSCAMDDPEQDGSGSRAPAIAGLAIAVVLLVVGIWLAHELTAASKMQDCLMSGRTNCNVIEPAQ